MADLPGQAIFDFHFKKTKSKLFVHDEFGPKVEMPVEVYFRDYREMPELERKALGLCHGNILDIGAGAGSHALELQKKNFEVTALEISPKACEVMADRGVKNVVCKDIFTYSGRRFDTIILLMNGIGLCGNLPKFERFLDLAENLLNPGGQLVFDSCDISYMYEEVVVPTRYFGEVRCKYEYKNEFSAWFEWLYIDRQTLMKIANTKNWHAEIIAEDDQSQYLVKMVRK